jgi:adenylate cyclase
METVKPAKTSNRRKTLIIILVFLILVFLEISANFPNNAATLERLELAARDAAINLRGGHPPNENIVIVAIDDESLSWVEERWPWSRARMAEIVRWLNDAGARVIAYDILLFDPSADHTDDQDLAQAFREAKSVVTVGQIFTNPYSTSTINRPEDIFQEVIDGYGMTEVERDDDAIVRSIRAFKQTENEFIYNWAFLVAQSYLQTAGPANPSKASLNFNGQTIPLNQRGIFLIDYAGPAQTYPTYSAAFVPLGDYDPAIFKDKIVFIGATSETLQDLYPTPFSATKLTPGVEVVANAVANLLSGFYLTIAPPWITLLILLGMAALSRLLVNTQRPTTANIFMVAGVLAYLALRQIIFSSTGLQLAIVSPTLMLILGVVVPSLEQAVTQEIEKRRVRSLFSRFISPQMVDQLLDTQDITSLNKRTNLTILFSDIRNFTYMSEQMLPEEVVSLLNPYLDTMSEIIHKYGGTVDKYEGDAIIAFFGEPIPHKDHALRAANAAMEMRSALKQLNQQWKSHGIFNQDLEMGIGLNTGDVFVGLIGSEQRINYTVIGDTANLAARLQDQTKELGFPILISESTNSRISKILQTEFVAERILKGKSEPVKIYRIVA